jgi:hypothetical protein
MKKWYLSIIYVCAFLCLFTASESTARDQAALTKRLSYLQNIPEISWVEYERNNVYIGFNKRPDDLRTIINAAAAMGNRAYGFGVHVWAVKANQRGWRPGDGEYYCEATARYGKVEKSSCR